MDCGPNVGGYALNSSGMIRYQDSIEYVRREICVYEYVYEYGGDDGQTVRP